MRMNVTVLSSLPPQRGVTPYTMQLLAALAARNDVNVDALGFRSLYPRRLYPGGAPDATDTMDDVTMPVAATRTLTWYNPLSWIRAGLSVRGDVVHAQWWSWFLAPPYLVVLTLARLRGKRIVVTVHNADPHEGGHLQQMSNRFVLPLAHRLIAHCSPNRQTLVARGAREGRVDVVPMGIGRLAGGRCSREDARGALGLAVGAPLVLFFGNIRPYKGVEDLIAAFREVHAELPQAQLAIVGQPWRGTASVLDAIDRAGIGAVAVARLDYVGRRDLQLFLDAADVVVFPYRRFDAQSAAAAEAIGAGRAIIVTDVGGLPDLVRDRRAVVPPGNVGALARVIVEVLEDEAWRRQLEADAALVRAGLSWDAIASATVQVYERAMSATAAAPAAELM
jgi:glycosyltransferase involved in cell wall biosynthesis